MSIAGRARLAAGLLAFCCALGWPGPVLAALAESEEAGREVVSSRVFDRFALEVVREHEFRYSLRVSHRGAPISVDLTTPRDPSTQISELPNTPRWGCRTMVAYCHSGGMHCCTDALVMVSCKGGQDLISLLELAHSPVLNFYDADQDRKLEAEVVDWGLVHYDYKGEGASLFLCFVQSPRLPRLLVLTNYGWRPDRPGEMPGYYRIKAVLRKAELREFQHRAAKEPRRDSAWERDERASAALYVAYVGIMAGDPDPMVRDELRQMLPPNLSGEADSLLADLRRAAARFNPVGD